MAELMAVYPPRGVRVHLFLEGYQPSAKRRDTHAQALCSASVNETTPPPVGPLPTGRVHAPFVKVQPHMDTPPPGTRDERPWPGVLPPTLRWCSLCIGRAVEHYGLESAVARLIAERAEASA